jgi:hypothetical protein
VRTPTLPAEKVREFNMSLSDFKLGTITLLRENRMPPTAMVESLNAMQVQDGVWTRKWGSANYSLPAAAALDGAFSAVNPDGTSELIEVADGAITRSTNGGSKTAVTLTSGTLTAGYECFFRQVRGYVYISNRHDKVVRYDTATKTATGYTALSTPVAATAAKTGLAGTNKTYYYVIVASNLVGTTVGSPEVSIQVGMDRDQWAGSTLPNTTNLVTLTLTRVTGASRYSIFISDQSGFELYLASVPDPGSGTTFTYVDDGTVAANDFVELPNDNTTGGPVLGPMELSGNRVWATQDPGNPWRVYWGGVGQYQGIFSAFYGGGYIDLELGGRERPSVPMHYRDGRGSSVVTVLTSDPEGNGSTWQITLDIVTVGTTSFVVPNAVKIVGSIGCSSPWGAAKVGDDIIFGNRKGAFSLGSQPSLLNVLATREISANIRRNWRALNGPAMGKHANYFYDAKLFWALPVGATENSQIYIRDSEKRNWQLAWEGVGIQSFFEYVDTAGKTHFLGVPVNGTQLIEFSESIQGDLGQAFTTRLKTGRLPVNANRNRFAQMEYAYLEVGNAMGRITMDIYGYDYKKGFGYLGSLFVDGATNSTEDWGELWSEEDWSYIEAVPVLSGPSIKRKAKKFSSKLVNDLQFVISCSGIADNFELLNAGASGYLADVDPPRDWKVKNSSTDRTAEDALLDSDGNVILDSNDEPILL